MSGVTLNSLLQAALSGQPYNHERLGREAKRYVRKITRGRAADLPNDIQDEIVGEAFVQVLSMPAPLGSSTSMIKLFRKAVLSAIRKVRADNAPPGRRTRQTKRGPAPRVAAEDIGRIPDAAALEASTEGEGDARAINLDRLPSHEAQRAILSFENRTEVAAILAAAPPPVATALRLVHLEGEPLGEVADALSLSRFMMSRRIATFAADWRAAA